jgi:hypothetical protein
MTRRLVFAAALVAGVAAVCAASCATPVESTESPVGPDRTTFAPVANALMVRCGTIDCHGSRYRNMRLYGYGGIRLDPKSRPDTPTTATDAEVAADYDAVVSLEPSITREVTAAKGAGADQLTFVRKGRGQEAHKGGSPIVPGDDADRCVLSWLAGAVDQTSCKNVVDAH